jgi:hypothetical protein
MSAYKVGDAGSVPFANVTYVLIFPYWLAATVVTTMTLLLIKLSRRTRVRHMRRSGGLCLNCGYDLRASSQQCPECGTPLPRPSHN